MYIEMYDEPSSIYDSQERDKTSVNDIDFTTQKSSGIRR